ncbi:hypothetical protein PU630_15425 [Microbacterium horticulturae]|uniref:YbaB/EbfC DNA-binding family protein n=1 Tax=Microbacterium horticulturae TaxID=3028316 RepID=A0ABY8BXK9_9MICO|nr:hypothetical protein [Microbacterium sp. KACC 23027]WEG08615.1 hypothetical protein PU630_15425 [Microbacterium sp. KACC 23027]
MDVPSVFESPEDSLAKIRDDVERAEARATVLPKLQDQIAQARARVVSRQRDIAVEVDSSGVLTVLDITDAALSRGGRAVSREVLDLIAAATLDVRKETLAISKELLGEDDPIVKLTEAQLDTDLEEHGGRKGGLK